MDTRLRQLLDFYNDDPTDPFIIYGIALEYQNFDLKTAESYFNILLEKFPEYLPAYYHAAKLYETLRKPDKAKIIYNKGIELARSRSEFHALRELNNALNLLLDEED
jgi:tetratricopeptide (TPR) repeat protein